MTTPEAGSAIVAEGAFLTKWSVGPGRQDQADAQVRNAPAVANGAVQRPEPRGPRDPYRSWRAQPQARTNLRLAPGHAWRENMHPMRLPSARATVYP
jgi:hypothetical protein